MIGRLVGEIVNLDPGQLLLDVSGVGYEVEIPLSTFYQLGEVQGPVTLHTHLVVREDAQLLYGFVTESERAMFRTLIRVNGVGPRVALAILSGLDAETLAASVRNNDVKALTAVPGVGKKTAERLIIEMRDKVESLALAPATGAGTMPADAAADAESALIGLGYKPQEAAMAVSRVDDPAADVETLIRQALRELMQG